MQRVIRRLVGPVLLGAVGLVGGAPLVGSTPQAAEETKTKLNAPTSETGASPIARQLEELSELVKRLSKDVSDLSSKVDALEIHTIKTLAAELREIYTTLKVVAQEVQDVSSSQPVPHVVTFRGMVQSDLQEIKQQLQRMAGRWGAVSGRLVVQNYTGTTQTLRLNGKDYLVPAGEMIIHNIPVQELEVYLPYHEPPQKYAREVWRQVGPNAYEFTLHIRPKQPIVILSQQ